MPTTIPWRRARRAAFSTLLLGLLVIAPGRSAGADGGFSLDTGALVDVGTATRAQEAFWRATTIVASPAGVDTYALDGEGSAVIDLRDDGGRYGTLELAGTIEGSFDARTGKVDGTFRRTEISHRQMDDTQFDEHRSVTFSGTVTGQLSSGTDVVRLAFAGTWVQQVTGTYQNGRPIDDQDRSMTMTERVDFRVAGAVPAVDTSTERIVIVDEASGAVYWSPSSEAHLEPRDRTWNRLGPSDRIALDEGVMLRTGADGTLKVRFDTGSLIRLQPSTLFTVHRITTSTTSPSVVYGRLLEGLASFYWQSNAGSQFELETDRANTSVKGTEWEVAVTEAATTVRVLDGVVAVTERATGRAVDVTAGQLATVDEGGLAVARADEADVAGSPADDAEATPPPSSDAGGVGALTATILRPFGVAAIVVLAGLIARTGRRSLARRSPPTA